jgi:hypothetical protein
MFQPRIRSGFRKPAACVDHRIFLIARVAEVLNRERDLSRSA